jgi:hypothetical protein
VKDRVWEQDDEEKGTEQKKGKEKKEDSWSRGVVW